MDSPRQLLAISITLDLADNAIVVDHSGMPASLASWLLQEAAEHIESLGVCGVVTVIRSGGPVVWEPDLEPTDDDEDD